MARPPTISLGSIPACAGKPLQRPHRRSPASVDPRVRGEAAASTAWSRNDSGRSPRARGSRFLAADASAAERSIPACAGKPAPPESSNTRSEVDPRVRGEASARPSTSSTRGGRSPRARGSRCPKLEHDHPLRSIPACAGKPRSLRSCSQRMRVDPRVRGEASFYLPSSSPEGGRSPRARGSRARKRRVARAQGSIPACAGKPLSATCLASASRVDPRVRGEA